MVYENIFKKKNCDCKCLLDGRKKHRNYNVNGNDYQIHEMDLFLQSRKIAQLTRNKVCDIRSMQQLPIIFFMILNKSIEWTED